MEKGYQKEEEIDDLYLIIGSFAHSLTNSIVPVRLMALEARRYIDSKNFEAASNVLGEIERQISDALKLLKSIGKVADPTEYEVASINDIVALALAACHVSDNVAVKVDYAAGDLLVQDVELLRGIFINLLTNALEAMPEGGTLQCITKPIESKKQVELWIEDSGSGISDEVKAHLFKPFVTTKSTGQGLGLWLSRQLIKRQGGELRLERSTVNQGTVFVITLPLHSKQESTSNDK
ncbi:HAMP domain-containing histidine kinase [Candidatus Microgenomates bacterium]|nr:HAMP domain-containing histidine kinase [Candidatus Microgenomates bacterium]